MKQVLVVIAGFLVAAIVPALAMALFTPAFNGSSVGIVDAASFYFFALIPTFVLGLPAFLVLLRFDLVRWWSSAITGVVIGEAVAFAILGNDAMDAFVLGFSTIVGALAALVFWVLVRQAIHHDGHVPAA